VAQIVGRGASKHMVEVDWNDTWEPLQNLNGYGRYDELYDKLAAELTASR
jgi:hypothetical protein